MFCATPGKEEDIESSDSGMLLINPWDSIYINDEWVKVRELKPQTIINNSTLLRIADNGDNIVLTFDNPKKNTFKIKHPQCMLIGGDFSQLEVKTAVFTSQDEKMIEAYKSGKDLYSLIGSMAYGVPYESALEFYVAGTELEIEGKKIICGHKTHTNVEGKKLRQSSKPILIGSIYQRGIASIAEQIGKSREEAQEIMDKFYKAFPTITAWMEERKQFVQKHGYVDNAVGRRRRLPDAQLPRYSITTKEEGEFNPLIGCGNRKDTLKIEKYQNLLNNVKYRKEYEKIQKDALTEGVEIHDNQPKIAQALRQAVNYPCQSLGADVVREVLLKVDKDEILNRLGFRLLIQVHDELIGECPEENAQEVSERLERLMIDVPTIDMGMNVPMSADTYVVPNWYADEVASSLLATFNKLLHKGMSESEVLSHIYEEHNELSQESIYNYLINGVDLKIS